MAKPIFPSSEFAEIFSFKFDKHKFPRIWEAKKRELTRNGLSEEEAEKDLLEMRIDMELIYEEDEGLFAVESEAIDCVDIYSPYTTTKCDVED